MEIDNERLVSLVEGKDRMGPLHNYNHLIALRNARVAQGIPLSYGVGTNGAVAKVNKEKIQTTITVRGRRTFSL